MSIKRRNARSILTVTALLLALSMTLVACGNDKPAETESVETTEVAETTKEVVTETTTAEETKDEIGEKSNSAVSFEFANRTGKDIKAISVRTGEGEENGKNLIKENDVFEKNEVSIVYLSIGDEDSTTAAEETALGEAETEGLADGEKLLNAEYEMIITFADDSEITLHSFPVEDIKNGEVFEKDGVGYIVYENLKGEKNISTQNAEEAIAEEKNNAEAAPVAEAAPSDVVFEEAAPAEAEQPVYEEPVYEEPVYEEPVYVEPAPEAPAEPAPEAPAEQPADNAGDDGCVDDGLFY